MPYLPEETTQEDQPRDAYGHFMPKDTPLEERVKTEAKIELSKNQPHQGTPDEAKSLDEPLVSLSIQNPFKKLLKWLNDFRKHQTTSFSFQVKIPLLALPIFLAVLAGAFQVFFSLGKQAEKQEVAAIPTPTPIVIIEPTQVPQPVAISKLGTVKATYQVTGLLTPIIPSTSTPLSTGSVEGSPSPTTSDSSPTPSRYVLLDKNDQITFLLTPPNLSLQYYVDKKVLVTGLYKTEDNTLTISRTKDIEVLP